MPWHVGQSSSCPASKPYAVLKDADGSVAGCHPTRDAANKQMAALYAAEPQASRRAQVAVSDKPWSQFSQNDYTPEQWRRACLIDMGQGDPDSKERYKLPVREPDGMLNRNGVHAAAGGHGVGAVQGVSMDVKHAAARKLVSIYRNDLGEDPPESLLMMAGMGGGRAEQPLLGPQVFVRSFPLEDIRILSRAQGSEYADGRTVEAYVAVFDRDAEITDQQGHYLESIARTSFDKAISESAPQGSRSTWRTGVFYNHGMTLYGTPSDRFSVPLGSPKAIRVEERGLLTVTRYNETPLADEILEAIRSGDITGHSFTGRIVKSDPARPPRGGYRRHADGTLSTVRRLELGLKEYGPTPFPAYADTAVVGVRSMLTGLAWPAFVSVTPADTLRSLLDGGMTAEQVVRMVAELEPAGSDTPEVAEVDRGQGAVTDEPPTDDVEHSSRHALLQRIAAAKTIRPGLARDPHAEAVRQRAREIARAEGGSQ